jgi:hypothetical protein
MCSERKPDAIRCSHLATGIGDAQSRLKTLHARFSELLGNTKIYVRHQGTEHFLSADPNDSLLHPSFSPKSGLAKYRWEDREDGVAYGFLDSASNAAGERTQAG